MVPHLLILFPFCLLVSYLSSSFSHALIQVQEDSPQGPGRRQCCCGRKGCQRQSHAPAEHRHATSQGRQPPVSVRWGGADPVQDRRTSRHKLGQGTYPSHAPPAASLCLRHCSQRLTELVFV